MWREDLESGEDLVTIYDSLQYLLGYSILAKIRSWITGLVALLVL